MRCLCRRSKHCEDFFLVGEFHSKGVRSVLEGKVAFDKIKAVLQIFIVLCCGFPAFVCNLENIFNSSVRESGRCSICDRARQIGNANVANTFLNKNGILMRGILAGFNCSARLRININDQ